MARDNETSQRELADETTSPTTQLERRTLIKVGLATLPVILTLRGRPLHASSGMATLDSYTPYAGQPVDDPYADPSLSGGDTFSQ